MTVLRSFALAFVPLAAATLAAAIVVPARAADPGLSPDTASEERLSALIEAGLHEGGSFFTSAEQAVIERACGYAPGEWDGIELNMMGGVMRCTNGRRVDDPRVRAIVRAAAPRISRRVEAVMARPQVAAAVNAIARAAEAVALRELASGREDR